MHLIRSTLIALALALTLTGTSVNGDSTLPCGQLRREKELRMQRRQIDVGEASWPGALWRWLFPCLATCACCGAIISISWRMARGGGGARTRMIADSNTDTRQPRPTDSTHENGDLNSQKMQRCHVPVDPQCSVHYCHFLKRRYNSPFPRSLKRVEYHQHLDHRWGKRLDTDTIRISSK